MYIVIIIHEYMHVQKIVIILYMFVFKFLQVQYMYRFMLKMIINPRKKYA